MMRTRRYPYIELMFAQQAKTERHRIFHKTAPPACLPLIARTTTGKRSALPQPLHETPGDKDRTRTG